MDKPEICALSTVQSVNRTGMFWDFDWCNKLLDKAGSLIEQYLNDEFDEMYGTAVIGGVVFKYYINDNPPMSDEEDWVQISVWVEVSPRVASSGMADLGTLAWHRSVWEAEIKPMFEPSENKKDE